MFCSRDLATERRLVAAFLVTAVLCLESAHSGSVAFQGCTPPVTCGNTTHNVTDPELDVYLVSTAPCFADGDGTDEGLQYYSGTSVRTGTSTNISHGGRAATVGQYCQPRGCSGPNCISYQPQNRNVTTIGLREFAPNGGQVYFPLTNNNTPPYLAIIDSHSGLTNGPRIWPAEIEGNYRYQTQVLTWPTSCNIQPTTHPPVENDVNVMACKPDWLLDGLGNVSRAPLLNITLNVPQSMESAETAARAAADSMSALGLGIVVSVTVGQTSCVTGSCVNLSEDYSGPNCAVFSGGAMLADGVYWTTSTIRLRTPTAQQNWRDSHPNRLKALIAHELLHYFGLEDLLHASCTASNTLMGPETPPGCNSPTAPPVGAKITPSWSDGAAVRAGSYATPPNRTRCGWGS